MMPRARGVVLCGGGTGGHVYPGLAVAAALRRAGQGDLRWVGDPQRIEARLVPAAGIPLLPWGLSRPRPADPRWLLHAVKQLASCWREFTARPPRAVVALGGYAALVPGFLAGLLRRPLVVVEPNAKAGRTNRLLSRLASSVVVQFAAARRGMPGRKVRVLGNPVAGMPYRTRGQGQGVTLLVMGGSLAATAINDLLINAAPGLARLHGLLVLHLAGEGDRARVADVYRRCGVNAEVLGYCNDMPSVYARADLALCRAGATSVAELCAAGIGALYVPLPSAADDHQTANARAVASAGGAVVLPQAKVSADGLCRVLGRLLADRQLVTRLGERAHALARPDAAAHVAALVQRSAA